MKQRLLFFFFLLLLVSGSGLYAQQQRDTLPGGKFKEIFGSLIYSDQAIPSWVWTVNWDTINVNKVDESIRKWEDSAFAYKHQEDEKLEKQRSTYFKFPPEVEDESFERENIWRVTWEMYMNSKRQFVDNEGVLRYSYDIEVAFYRQQDSLFRLQQSIPQTANKNGSAAQWTLIDAGQCTRPTGEPMSALGPSFSGVALCRTKPNILYFNNSRRTYRSVDRGLTWQAMSDAVVGGTEFGHIGVHPVFDSVLYQVGTNGVVYQSINAGQSWTVNTAAGNLGKRDCIVFSPFGSRVWLSGGSKTLFSTDGGNSWNAPVLNGIPAGRLRPFYVIYHATDSTRLFMMAGMLNTAGNKVVKTYTLASIDTGWSFHVIDSTSIPVADTLIDLRMAVTPANPNMIYMAAWVRGTGYKVYKSSNAGQTWSYANYTGGYYADLGIAVSPKDSNIVCTGSQASGVAVTRDGGATWVGRYAAHQDHNPYTIDTSGRVYVASHGGLVYSDDYFNTQTVCYKGIGACAALGFAHSWRENFFNVTVDHNGNTVFYRPNYGDRNMSFGGYEHGNAMSLQGPGLNRHYGGKGFYYNGNFIAPASLPGAITAPDPNIGRNLRELTKNGNYVFAPDNINVRIISNPRYANIIYQTNYDSSLWVTYDRGYTMQVLKHFNTWAGRFAISRSNPKVLYVNVGGTIHKTNNGGATWTNTGMPCSFDVAIHPTNENILWTSYGNGLLKSVNGGTSWINMGGTGYPVYFVVPQGGSEDGVYTFGHSFPPKVFYKDNSKTSWVNFNSGLVNSVGGVTNPVLWFGGDTLRVASWTGIWQSPVYAPTDYVQALPMTNQDTVRCAKDTVQFSDLSLVRYAGATFRWSFPGAVYVSDSTSLDPKVVFGGAPGWRSVSLFVQDASGQKDSVTIPNMVFIRQNCAPDTIPNKALLVDSAANYALTGTVNLNTTNTITLSAWVKLPKVEPDWAGLITNGVDGGTGLLLRPGNQLGYYWKGIYWTWGGGPVVPLNLWTHVALVIEPSKATIYMNGKPYSLTATHAASVLNSSWYLGCERGYISRTITGLMDEVAIYNRALSQQEIREQMHLTKNYDSTDAGLKAYYQFNESSGDVVDRIGLAHASLLGTASRVPSTAPVGSGRSQTIAVTSGGLKDFSNAEVELTFPGSGTYPNGDVVATRLNVPPDQLATTPTLPTQPKTHYWIIHNYGTNSSFSSLTGIKFKQVLGTTPFAVSTPALIKLYKRGSTDDGTSWGSPLDAADNVTDSSGIGTVSFTTGLSNTGFSQYMMGTLGVPLPVRLLRFTGVKEGEEAALLRWEVADELDLWGYELERSTDGVNYITIGQVPAAGADSYSYRDNGPVEGYNYYRLKMKDTGGRSSYSNVVILLFGSKEQRFSLSPVPAGDNVMLRMSRPLAEDMTADLYTAGGHLLSRYSIPRGSSNRQIDLAKYASGMYIISVKNAKGDILFKQMFSKE